ncbi:hypothetical protein CWR48_15770 [Oceanobacillus arenosus]|uniref:Peptidoglycan hydrolase n=1 Tax=Oceanobacillus arenosus TaxID=1229153 RepID=A0A3D8PK90_9BACI|nr:glucosaminidase domain-containing protein [Oceanobacillus arenosus]RDW16503.1 hypothetical protein CWR48_15770 [Oceanobacillus arenosus]
MSAKTDNFLNKIKPGALQLWSKFGILPSVAAGQAALESAWGASGLATKYNNLFGIKGSYNGNSAMMDTWEVYGGERYDIKDNFRAYPNWSTSILDYCVFLTVNQRYKAAIGVSDYKKQITAIHKAGYATDPKYASKVINIINTYNLDVWDREVLTNNKVANKPADKPKKSTISVSTYTVKSGDKLSKIAKDHNTTVAKLADINNISNPNLIHVGQKIKLTGSTAATKNYHTVKSGDTVSALSNKYGSTWAQIKSWNGLDKNYTIYAGQKLRVK